MDPHSTASVSAGPKYQMASAKAKLDVFKTQQPAQARAPALILSSIPSLPHCSVRFCRFKTNSCRLPKINKNSLNNITLSHRNSTL